MVNRGTILGVLLVLASWSIPASAVYFAKGWTEQRTETREEQIRQWIMHRNPEATMRDFEGLPATLLRASKDSGLDYRVVMAVIEMESEWKPRAVSPKGAIGLMQLMPDTATGVAKRVGLGDFRPPVRSKSGGYTSLGSLADPKTNVSLGIVYLAEQVSRFGVSPEALQAYNRGPGKASQRWAGDTYARDVAMKFFQLSFMFSKW